MTYADEKFEWDTEKADLNAAKHGITFDEARARLSMIRAALRSSMKSIQ